MNKIGSCVFNMFKIKLYGKNGGSRKCVEISFEIIQLSG